MVSKEIEEEARSVLARIKELMDEQVVMIEKEKLFYEKLDNDITRIYNMIGMLKNKVMELELRILKLEERE